MSQGTTVARLIIPAVLMLPGLLGGTAGAADYPQQDALVTAYYQAINRGDFPAAAALVDPASARALQVVFNRLLVMENAAGGSPLLHQMYGPQAQLVDGLSATPMDFYQRALRLGYDDRPRSPQTRINIDVLGHVEEGNDMMHVVLREITRDAQGLYSTPRVVATRENRTGWRLMVPYEMWQGMSLMRRSVSDYAARRLGGPDKRPTPVDP